MKYLICLDLDGTLLNNDSKLSKNSVNYLEEIKKDHIICIVTGRPLRTSIQFYNQIGLDTIICNYNGTMFSNPKDERFVKTGFTMNINEVKKFYDVFKDDILHFAVECDEKVYVSDTHKEMESWESEGSIVTPMKEIEGNPNGVVITLHNDRVNEAFMYLADNDCTIGLRTWPFSKDKGYTSAEIYSKLADKGTALNILRQYYSGKFDDVICCGDSHNDIPMLEIAKYSCAMKDASSIVKNAAHYSTESNQDDGVIKFIKKAIKNEL